MFIIRSLGPRHFKMCVHADLQPLKVFSEKTCNFIKKRDSDTGVFLWIL